MKPVLSCHSKNKQNKGFKTNGSLMKVESIAECSLGAFCNTFDPHKAIIGIEYQVLIIFQSGRFRQILLYMLLFRGMLNFIFKRKFPVLNHAFVGHALMKNVPQGFAEC